MGGGVSLEMTFRGEVRNKRMVKKARGREKRMRKTKWTEVKEEEKKNDRGDRR